MDFDRRTGAVIDNFASAVQSVEVIVTTQIGDVVMLREFGGGLSSLLGRLMTPQLFGVFRLLMAAAIDLWEPRFRVRSITIDGAVEALRVGTASLKIEVDWRPRGHLGDDTVESVRSFLVVASGKSLIAIP